MINSFETSRVSPQVARGRAVATDSAAVLDSQGRVVVAATSQEVRGNYFSSLNAPFSGLWARRA